MPITPLAEPVTVVGPPAISMIVVTMAMSPVAMMPMMPMPSPVIDLLNLSLINLHALRRGYGCRLRRKRTGRECEHSTGQRSDKGPFHVSSCLPFGSGDWDVNVERSRLKNDPSGANPSHFLRIENSE